MKKSRKVSGVFLLVLSLFLSSCATYYQRNMEFQNAFTSGDLQKANKLLEKNDKDAEGKNRVLHFIQKGVVLQMLGQLEESNKYFEQAYTTIEDHKKSLGSQAWSLLTNPATQTYTGEDHEKVLIHYYKALNYLQLGQPQSALVEAKRLNIKLQELNLRYENRKNRYQDDAFAHVIMGIAYEMDRDYNNAFIAYRNAYNTYKDSYSTDFDVAIPEQLKQDLLRTAYITGFQQELDFYEREFGKKYTHNPAGENEGELIFFWHNGLGPVKGENSINFTVIKGQGGVATFLNEDMGLNFSFPLPQSDKESSGLGDLKLVRVAFPKYLERPLVFHSAELSSGNKKVPLEKAENINAIAFSVLQDRMLREMATSLLRLAIKQAAEEATRSENEDLGAVLSIVNALTEKADTRNWQTLPYYIHYGRMTLPAGENTVNFKASGKSNQTLNENFTFDIQKGRTLFHVFTTLDSYPAK